MYWRQNLRKWSCAFGRNSTRQSYIGLFLVRDLKNEQQGSSILFTLVVPMKADHLSVPFSTLIQDCSTRRTSSTLMSLKAAMFRAEMERESEQHAWWGHWSHNTEISEHVDYLAFREGEEPVFQQGNFVVVTARAVEDCLRCVEEVPDSDTLLEYLLEADELFRMTKNAEIRVGFFLPESCMGRHPDLVKGLRSSGLRDVKIATETGADHRVWYFKRDGDEWTFCSSSLASFVRNRKRAIKPSSYSSSPDHTIPRNQQGQTPLHEAVLEGQVHRVESLINAGMSPSERDHLFNSPLHLAARENRPECVRMLLRAGASWKELNHRSRTPLHLAASASAAETLACLLDAGADPDVITERGISPLHMASWYGSAEIVDLLIQAGASINLVNDDGNSCLHLAAGNGQVKLVKILIGVGANPDLLNHRGLSYLEVFNEGYSGPAIPVM